MITYDLSILNQKGTPMFYSDLTANRPAFGIVGRIFIATDSPYGIFRDTGSAWDQISSAGGGATIYTGDGTLLGNRIVTSGGYNLTYSNDGLAQYASVPSGLKIINNTASSGGINQYSPPIIMSGAGWNFGGSTPISIRQYLKTLSAIPANPIWQLESSINNGAYTPLLRAYTNGTISGLMIGSSSQIADAQIAATGKTSLLVAGDIRTFGGYQYDIGLISSNVGSYLQSYTNNGASPIQSLFFSYYTTTFNQQDIIFSGGTTSSKYFGYSTGNWTIGGVVDAGYKLDVQGTSRFTGNVNFGNWQMLYGGGSFESTTTTATIYYNGPIRINGTSQQINIGSGATGIGLSIGSGSNAVQNNISIGNSASTILGLSIAIGNGAVANSTRRQLAIGNNSTVLHHSSIALNGAVTTAPNQFVAGVMWYPQGNEESTITDVYFGSGVQRQWYQGGLAGFDGNGVSYTINGSGALGTNFSGGNINIAGGKGTGIGTSGDVIISTASTTTSGTTLQSLTERLKVFGNTGNVLIQNGGTFIDAGYKLQVTNTSADAHLLVWGASSPSIRLDNNYTGASQRFAIGLSTATNNFIQGSVTGDICITTASANPMIFGMWQTINANEVMRLSTASNLLIGTAVDSGNKLRLNGSLRIDGQTSATSGGVSGQHLIIYCDGVQYKIELRNP